MGKIDRNRDIEQLIGNGIREKSVSNSAKQSRSVPSGADQSQSIPAEVTQRALMDFLGIAPQSMSRFSRENIFIALPSGRYEFRTCVRGYITAIRKGSNKLQEAKLRREIANAEKTELQNEAARRELLPAGEVEREWSNALRDLRAALLALPSRLQQRLPHLTAHDIAIADREIRDVLTELAGDD